MDLPQTPTVVPEEADVPKPPGQESTGFQQAHELYLYWTVTGDGIVRNADEESIASHCTTGIIHTAGASTYTWHATDVSLPALHTGSPLTPMLTSQQILLSFPALQRPGTSMPYKCAKCCHFYSSDKELVDHVLNGVDGDFSCRRFFQQWRQFRASD